MAWTKIRNRVRVPLVRNVWFSVALVFIGLFAGLFVNQWPRLRERTVYQALIRSTDAAFWWPAGWKRELRHSFLLEGEMRPAKSGTLELLAETHQQVFRTTVINGRFTFKPQRLPAGPVKIRFVSSDGSTSRWIGMGLLDPGLHRVNLAFESTSLP